MTDEKMTNEDMVLKLIERIHGLEKQIAVCNSSHKLTEDRLKALEEKCIVLRSVENEIGL